MSHSRPKRASKHTGGFSYQLFEEKQLLATISTLDVATGTWEVQLTEAHDEVVIDTDSGLATINSSEDLDSVDPGVQALSVQDLQHLIIQGSGLSNQSANLNGDYGAGIAKSLENISIKSVDKLSISGNYEIQKDLTVEAPQASQPFQVKSAQVNVGNVLGVEYGADVLLNDSASQLNFGSIQGDFGGDLFIREDEIDLGQVHVAEELVVDARWIRQLKNTYVTATKLTNFGGLNLNSSLNDFDRVAIRSPLYEVSVADVDDLILEDEVRSTGLEIAAGGSVSADADLEKLFVRGVLRIKADRIDFSAAQSMSQFKVFKGAQFSANADIRLNVLNGTTVVPDFRSTVSATGSSIELSDSNRLFLHNLSSKSDTHLVVGGNLLSTQTGIFSVAGKTTIQSVGSIKLQSKSNDFGGTLDILSGRKVQLFDINDLNIGQMDLSGLLQVTTVGHITSNPDSRIAVQQGAEFVTNQLTLGAAQTETIAIPRLQVETPGDVIFYNTLPVTFSSRSSIGGDLSLVADGRIVDANRASLSVTGETGLTGSSIRLGDQNADFLQLGHTVIDATGNVFLNADGDVTLTDRLTANALRIIAKGSISNLDGFEMQVYRTAGLEAESISLGAEASDFVNLKSLHFQSKGDVEVNVDSDLLITQDSHSVNADLTSLGKLEMWTHATLDISGHAAFKAAQLSIGMTSSDFFHSGTLAFDAVDLANVHQDSEIHLSGQSRAGWADLKSTSHIRDARESHLIIEKELYLTGIDLIIGELGFGCLDLIQGEEFLIAEASGQLSITLGCDHTF
jgi:hypothetical protein